MSDPFDVLRDELVAAEGRMVRGRRRSPWLRRRPLLLAAALVVASGSAAAAVVSLTSEDSAPLSGTVPTPSPTAAQRTYRIELMPDLRAGQIGWCSTLALRSRRGPIGAVTGCGPAAPADAAQIAGGGVTVGRDRIILFTVVDKRVATVRLHDGRTIAPLPDRRLPYGWRGAVAFVTREHGNVDPTDLDWTLQDAAGRPISTAPNERAGTKHAGTATLPTRTVDPRDPPHARCTIRARPLRHLRAVSAKVVTRMPATTPDVNCRAFLTSRPPSTTSATIVTAPPSSSTPATDTDPPPTCPGPPRAPAAPTSSKPPVTSRPAAPARAGSWFRARAPTSARSCCGP
jgi:hypothetical protein